MVHNGYRLPLPDRSRRRVAEAQEDLVLVHSWLRRSLPKEQAEDVTVAVLARAQGPGPACVAAAPPRTRLQFLSVQAVLRARGVL